ncbi:isocitrate lyase/phosphoenolpyruvate mutase family protein [Catenovulum sp. SM1970]|uniref:isocitrate lyase/PEP mutase family protein n=1 Tax=Marinifaba aquimaris TaxID=2741323 RepID=UPI001571E333|nr:isocitrate lyase/phosphoenolpyruvate mutase family protein [Marinifaba aquimaris]NTS76641.1 isocitrate lyase/phosphoenolpyruvate mutase family protein [Marinifaba aquimaris]
MDFKQLHHQNKPLLICNVWNTHSAQQAQELGFQAIGTSSAAIANSLGYQDGEDMTFAELCFIVERLAKSVSIPISVDIESGYSRNAQDILSNINKLIELGVSGINIEDSIVQNGKRTLLPADEFTDILRDVKKGLKNSDNSLFINVRTDPFLLGASRPLETTIERIHKYEKACIDGIFVPCAVILNDIKQLVSSTSLPINLLAMPDMANFEMLGNIGIKRLSMGNWLYDKLNRSYVDSLKCIQKEGTFSELFT